MSFPSLCDIKFTVKWFTGTLLVRKSQSWSITCSFGSNSSVLLVCHQLSHRQELSDVVECKWPLKYSRDSTVACFGKLVFGHSRFILF